MADFLYRADLLPRGDVYTPYDTGVARVGSVFTLITVVNNNVKPCINREFNPALPPGSAALYTWPIFHHLCDYFIFWEEEEGKEERAYWVLLFCLLFSCVGLKSTSSLGSAVEQRPKYWLMLQVQGFRYRGFTSSARVQRKPTQSS